MDGVYLVRPCIEYETGFLDMARQWRFDADDAPWYAQYEGDFLAILSRLDGYQRGIGLPEGFVPNSTYWLIGAERRVVGALNLRHCLNDALLSFHGQIGYAIRPSERGKGYGKEILRLGLLEAKKMRLEKVLVCCYQENAASARIIEANGGVLEDQKVREGKVVNRYWIAL